MNITCLQEYCLGGPLEQVRSVPVSLGKRGEAVLFVYSSQDNLDPWCESFHFPKDTLKMALYTRTGQRLWVRDLGEGIVPGIWFTPFISFDLDGDGVDEIWFVNNLNPDLPMTLNYRYLQRVNPLTGEDDGRWPWPNNIQNDTMSHTYRFFIAGGYVRGEPVLVCSQGTYGDMYLQAYNKDIQPRWEIVIDKDEPGARSSHVCPVIDFNADGVDEMFWGERLLSLDDGHEIFCGDRDFFAAHSDIIIPFVDPKTGNKYFYTCREGQNNSKNGRVVLYDGEGKIVWNAIEAGHMHRGYVATLGDDHRRIAMAMRLERISVDNRMTQKTQYFFFDALTGQSVPAPFEQAGMCMPIDFDGDGYHEMYCLDGNDKGWVFDRHGEKLAYLGGRQVRSGKILPHPGMQLMVYDPGGTVRIFGDAGAQESDYFRTNCDMRFHTFNQHLMGTGYNHVNAVVACSMT